tara:strand:+ start:14532 stop:14735 length:204 start_codon:yes stop_codon:yes gene_type:complete
MYCDVCECKHIRTFIALNTSVEDSAFFDDFKARSVVDSLADSMHPFIQKFLIGRNLPSISVNYHGYK